VLVPGTGLIVAGRRALGRLVLGAAVLAVVAAGAFVLLGDPLRTATRIGTSDRDLLTVAVALGIAAALWTALVLGTHRSLRRGTHLGRAQRVLSTVLAGALVVAGALPAAQGSRYALITRDTLSTVFAEEPTSITTGARRPEVAQEDPWASVPRVNVLLIGSDAGANRDGLRPDTLIVASIDTRTGRTVLVSLPRNLENVPLPPGPPMAEQYPNGYRCIRNGVRECLLNAIWSEAAAGPQEWFKANGIADPGLWTTAHAVQNITGLQIDKYVMLDLAGFRSFVDALKGVTVTVDRRYPIGGRLVNGRQVGVKDYLEPGRRKLNGYEVMWFARSRSDSDDYSRMRRQRCVIAAIVAEASPQTMARQFPAIASVAKDSIRTDIAQRELQAWVDLSLKVRAGGVRSLTFTNSVVNPADPDYDRMRSLVAAALEPPPAPRPTATARPTRTPVPTPGRPTPRPTPSDAAQAVDVASVCG
jgi:LCP family protein required for cell wall assembly